MTTTIITRTTDGWTAEDFPMRDAVIEAAPAWCDSISAYDEASDDLSVGYDFSAGSVELGTSAFRENGSVRPADDGAVFLNFREHEATVTADSLRRYAADFLAAAAALDRKPTT